MIETTKRVAKQPPPTWIKDAKRRGAAIVQESEKERNQTSHAKETTMPSKKMTRMLDRQA